MFRFFLIDSFPSSPSSPPFPPHFFALHLRSPAYLINKTIQKDAEEGLRSYFEKLLKQKKRERTSRIVLCSTQKDKDLVAEALSRFPDRVPGRDPVYVGQRVQVLEDDVVGTLDQAWEMNGDQEGRKLTNKEPLEVSRRSYKIVVEDRHIVWTLGKTVERADVVVASKYAGRPYPDGIFIVGEKTTGKDLVGSAKYCLDSLTLVFLPGCHIGTVSEYRDPDPTDLARKLESK